jgi:phosphopantothenoylcysteine decarboxylase
MDILKGSDHANDRKLHLLLAATGSVATIKIPNIAAALHKYDNLSIRIVLTESAAEFLQGQADEQPSLEAIAKIKNVDGIYRDSDEWRKPWVRGDSILHIELRRWADMMVIAPLSANSLAKIALGLSDNLVTSVVRAWDTTGAMDITTKHGVTYGTRRNKLILVAPAMNTAMWEHPVTAEHLRKIGDEWGTSNKGWFKVLRPVEKELACGDTGSGAMKDWREIVEVVEGMMDLEPRAADGSKGSGG